MLGKIAGMITVAAVFFSLICGRMQDLAPAVLDGAADAVTLTVSLMGMMGLWCGILRVLREVGVIEALTKLIRPFLRVFFPEASLHDSIAQDIAANISANLLGVGNAATPLALSAMKKLQAINPDPSRASPDMVTLAVLNTASVSLVPSTVLTILRAAGSENPFLVIVPIWITSFTCAAIALLLCRTAGGVGKRKVPGYGGRRLTAEKREPRECA